MATFIRHDNRRIVFKCISDEGADGVIYFCIGAFFAILGGSFLVRAVHQGPGASVFWMLFDLAALLPLGLGLYLLTKSEWLEINLATGKYRGCRSVPFCASGSRGPLTTSRKFRSSKSLASVITNSVSGPSPGSGRISRTRSLWCDTGGVRSPSACRSHGRTAIA